MCGLNRKRGIRKLYTNWYSREIRSVLQLSVSVSQLGSPGIWRAPASGRQASGWGSCSFNSSCYTKSIVKFSISWTIPSRSLFPPSLVFLFYLVCFFHLIYDKLFQLCAHYCTSASYYFCYDIIGSHRGNCFWCLISIVLLVSFFTGAWSCTGVWLTARLLRSTGLSILADLNNNLVWIVSDHPPLSRSFSYFCPLGIVLSVLFTIGITVTLMFNRFVCSLARSKYLSLISLSLIFTMWSPGKSKSTIRQVFIFCF